MATPHQEGLSCLTFGEIWQVISAPENWDLFAPYFPPKDIVVARINEVKTIRNRVAHCRAPHENDERRLELFLRDMDPGFRRFCLRYSQPAVGDKSDSVANELESNWKRYGYSTEMFSTDLGWIYAPEPHKGRPRLGAQLSRICGSSDPTASRKGTIYRLELFALGGEYLRLLEILESAESDQGDLLHVIVSDSSKVLVTLPGLLGTSRIVKILARFLARAQNALSDRAENLQRIKRREWPEWFLLPNHPLAWFDSEYEGPLIDLDPL